MPLSTIGGEAGHDLGDKCQHADGHDDWNQKDSDEEEYQHHREGSQANGCKEDSELEIQCFPAMVIDEARAVFFTNQMTSGPTNQVKIESRWQSIAIVRSSSVVAYGL